MTFQKKSPWTFIILAFVLLFGATYASAQNNKSEMTDPVYPKAWAEIDSLSEKRLVRSVLTKVKALKDKAKRENRPIQVIKALVYQARVESELSEDNLLKAIELFEEAASESSGVYQAVHRSILAEFYQNYLENNYWRIQDRSKTTDDSESSIKTWGAERLQRRTFELFRNSIQDPALKNIKLEEFASILKKDDYIWTKDLRPSLYDLLAHRVINYLSNSRSYLSESANSFEIDDASYFGSAREFVELELVPPTNFSMSFEATKVFQSLLAYRLGAQNTPALIDLDLKRIQFIYNKSTHPDKQDLYRKALEGLIDEYKFEKGNDLSFLKLAEWHQRRAYNYNPEESQQYKGEAKKAWDYCQLIQDKFPKSYGAARATSLQKSIETPSLEVNTEMVLSPGQASLAKLSFKNLKQVYFRIIKITPEEEDNIGNAPFENRNKFLGNLPVFRKWTVKLPDDGDFNEHSIETKISSLPFGYYLLIFSDKENFKSKSAVLDYVSFAVSDLAYLNRRNLDELNEFIVVNRRTGEPLEGVKATFYESRYNQRKRAYETREISNGLTDPNGFITMLQSRTSFSVKFEKGEDVLYFRDGYYNRERYENNRTVSSTYFFLDRAIYRPGQTVFFKGILTERNTQDNQVRILKNKTVNLVFRDANYQEVATQTLRTNEFGTFNGSLVIPQGGLTGIMHIESKQNGNKSFRVEEYKRPKFKAEILPLEGDYVVNQMVNVKGKATGFAGDVIDGAKVNYRIIRRDLQPYPWIRQYYFNRSYYQSNQVQIGFGSTTTDENGQFEIDFEAIPNPDRPKETQPRFRYEISVDVVDITGETQSANGSVTIGYTGLVASINIPDELDRSTGKFEAKISTNNYDGQALTASGQLSIRPLASPDRVFKRRYWSLPDLQAFSEKDFRKDFPDFAYADEDKPKNWERLSNLIDGEFNTAEESTFEIDLNQLPVGIYEVLLESADAQGNEVIFKKMFAVLDSEEEAIPKSLSFWKKTSSEQYEPEEDVQVTIASNYADIKVLIELEKDNRIIQSDWVDLENWLDINKLIEESDRGNFHFHFSFVKNNRAYTQSELIRVPFTNKELKFEYMSFRDQLRPGEEEEWTIRVMGPKKEKVAAEMVATMYDASLDQFVNHYWYLSLYSSTNYARRDPNAIHFRSKSGNLDFRSPYYPFGADGRRYPELDCGDYFLPPMEAPVAYSLQSRSAGVELEADEVEESTMAKDSSVPPPPPPPNAVPGSYSLNEDPSGNENNSPTPAPIQVRKELDETVFFIPNLYTDEEGNVVLKFKMKEALTSWKFLGLAHTSDLKYGLTQKEIITQKELMVQPNAPRFVREGDAFEFTAKVSNLTEAALSGQASIEFFDAATMEPVNELLSVQNAEISFTAEAGQSARLGWKLLIPEGKVNALTYRVIAQAGQFADGEENTLPVLSNRMLVTETIPLAVRGGQNKTFDFAAFQRSQASPTARAHQFQLEFTSNPAWLAVQALPYLMEYPHECSEQLFNRMYANMLAAHIANSHPNIKAVFDSWQGTDALESNLNKNKDLKAALLEETPWVMDALSEKEQKAQIALLFDLDRMGSEADLALSKLRERQLPEGGFAWFSGGRYNWYITTYIVAGMGHLQSLNVMDIDRNKKANILIRKAIEFADEHLNRRYAELIKLSKEERINLENDHLTRDVIQYLYARSFFIEVDWSPETKNSINFYTKQAQKYWTNKGLQQQAQLGLIANRMKMPKLNKEITASLQERALLSEELGAYWKYNTGYYWYQAPIETHALMIELFNEIGEDDFVDELKIWLLKNKQTNNWKTTKATSAAIYALLNTEGGEEMLMEDQLVDIQFPDLKKKDYKDKLMLATSNAEIGTGQFETKWTADEVQAGLGKIKVKNPNKVISWGAAYWQYFEDLDKIQSFADTPLKLKKALYKSIETDTGTELSPVKAGDELHVGDKMIVRLELSVDRDMEFIHLKDMRASGLEPINVLSGYRWQGGLGYYESTKDVATHFFFDYLPKGTYTFEYPVRAQLQGTFSNGISSIQSMYAPEFASHSEGLKIKIEE